MRFLLFFIALSLFGEVSFKQIEIAKGYAVNSAHAWDYNKDGKANFTKYIISENQKGYDLDLQDLNQDGKVDIVESGSSGRDVRVYIQK